jgi:hypothetical protein
LATWGEIMSNQENKAAKNQHYVPQFYLKYFADNDKLYVFEQIAQLRFFFNA